MSLFTAPKTIAGHEVADLSDADLLTMKSELQAQLSNKRAEVEMLLAESGKKKLPEAEWHEYQNWRSRVATIISLIEKERSLRGPSSKAAGAKEHRDNNRLFQIHSIAAWLMADQFLDVAQGEVFDAKAAARDAVRVAALCYDEVGLALAEFK